MESDKPGAPGGHAAAQWPPILENEPDLAVSFELDLASDALPTAAYFRAVAERMGED